MYERQFFARFRQSNGIRSALRLGSWFICIVACSLSLLACGLLGHSLLRVQADSNSCAYPDTRIVVDIYPSHYRDTVYLSQ